MSVKTWFAGLALAAGAFAMPAQASAAANPLFDEWKTPFGVPPFESIRTEHYLPAIREGITRHRQEVEAIAANPAAPTFANTVEALERSGAFLTRANNVFDVLNESMTDDAMQAVAEEKTPLLTSHRDDILLNEKLFTRIRAVWEARDRSNLAPEQARLLERIHKNFVRGGAALDAEKKAQLRKVNEELALLTLKFGNNVLAETNGFKLVIDNQADLAGLPPMVVAAAAEAATARKLPGKWVFTPHKPSLIPFLEYSSRRDLREKMFRAYTERGNYDNEFDNKALASRIAALRVTQANLLGFPTYAAYALDDAMAKTPDRVLDFLNRLWTPAQEVAKLEAAQYQTLLAQGRPAGHPRALGLVLLRAARCARRSTRSTTRSCAPTSSSRTSSTAPSGPPPSCSGSASSSGRTCPSTIRTCASSRSPRRTAAPSASSTSTTSRARASAAARG